MSGCTQKSGFLSLFSCGDPVIGMCVTCGKPVCAAHLQAASNCPDCATLGLSDSDTIPRSMESSHSGHSGLNERDYAAFDTVQGGGGEVMERQELFERLVGMKVWNILLMRFPKWNKE